jgi:GntR family transcriptional repressor for pyruvate dehydrogenase complex
MPLFKSVKTQFKMPEAIVQQIEKKILFGKLKPNSKLPSEAELMKQFGVSRNTVREALRMLEASGILKVKRGPHGGTMITQITNEFISDFLVKAIRMGGLSGKSFAQFRVALEPSIAEMVATIDIDPELLSKMEQNIHEVRKMHENNEVRGLKHMDFHVLLATATSNPMFIIILRTLKILFYTITPVIIQTKMFGPTIEHHQKILNAIKNHDSFEAKRCMYEHMAELSEVLQGLDFAEIYRAEK